MTFELAICLLLAVVAFPASRSIAAHYAFFAAANLSMVGVTNADSSILAMLFAIMAIADCMIVLCGGAWVLMFSATASMSLSLESVGNGDWLLNHIEAISLITNVAIISCLVKEYWHWMHGRSEH